MSWRNLQRVLVFSSEDPVTTRWALFVLRCIIDILKALRGCENNRILRPALRRGCSYFSAKLLWSAKWSFCCKSGLTLTNLASFVTIYISFDKFGLCFLVLRIVTYHCLSSEMWNPESDSKVCRPDVHVDFHFNHKVLNMLFILHFIALPITLNMFIIVIII